MITSERTALFAVLLLVVSTFYFVSAPQRQMGDNNALDTTSQLHLVDRKDGAAGTISIRTTRPLPADIEFLIDLDSNVVSEPREQTEPRKALGVDFTYSRNRSLIAPAYNFPFTDLGTFATVIPSTEVDDLAVGLRISPLRLLYGTTATDILLAQHYVGVGISLYAPPDIMGRSFAHWGIGVGHFWPVGDVAGATQSNSIYLSFSTFIP